MNLVQLVYASRMSGPLSMSELVQMLDVARSRNAQAGLTGMLTFGAEEFLQVLEGPAEAVNALYSKLMTDPRHKDLVLLGYGPIAVRQFADWSMGFYSLGDDGLLAEAGLPADRFDPASMKYEQALRLLRAMSDRLGRAGSGAGPAGTRAMSSRPREGAAPIRQVSG